MISPQLKVDRRCTSAKRVGSLAGLMVRDATTPIVALLLVLTACCIAQPENTTYELGRESPLRTAAAALVDAVPPSTAGLWRCIL